MNHGGHGEHGVLNRIIDAMATPVISVEGEGFDPLTILDSVRAHFPEAVVDPTDQFARRLELMGRLDTPPSAANSTRRLSQRVGVCYAWQIPQGGRLKPVECFVRSNEFTCIAVEELSPSIRQRILALAATLGMPEILE